MKKQPKKKAAGIMPGQLVMMAVFLVLGGVCGLLAADFLVAAADSFGMYLISLGVLILLVDAAMLVQIILHEGGHLAGGLLSGYQFCSFRIFGLMLVRGQDGRLHLRHMQLAGTAGQCLMAPPDPVDGAIPVMLYNLGGPLANLVTAAAFFGLSFAVSAPFAVLALRILAVMGLGFGLINGLPLAGPVDNDGKNALSLRKDPHALRAFWAQMKVAAAMADGDRLRDMPQQWFDLPPDADMNNALVATQAVFACNRLMDAGDFDRADAAMAALLAGKNGVLELHRALLRRERAFLELLGQNRPHVLQSLYTAADTKLLQTMRSNPSVIRMEYAWALLAQQDAKKAADLKAAFEKAAARHPYPSEIAGERELMALADAAAAK